MTREALRFLRESVRPDGSWPIDTNLATWTTSLAINALAADPDVSAEVANLSWFLDCQHRVRHPFTGADPGGWGWTDLSGAVPDADDTAGALLACARWPGVTELPAAVRQSRGRRGSSGRAVAARSAEPRRRLAHVLSRMGQIAVRPQRCRPDGARHASAACVAAGAAAANSERRAARLEVSGKAPASGRQLGAVVVRQPGPSAGRESRVRDRARPAGLPRTGRSAKPRPRDGARLGWRRSSGPMAAGAAD